MSNRPGEPLTVSVVADLETRNVNVTYTYEDHESVENLRSDHTFELALGRLRLVTANYPQTPVSLLVTPAKEKKKR